jgi:DNA sulfur modification protein DndD
VIIESITLHNYGIYKGKNTFQLNPEKNKPIILIGGLNGHGKTTLLEALQIGFFGRKLTDIYQGKKLTYEEFIKKTINKDSDSSLIQINFHQIEKGVKNQYSIYRTWSRNGKPLEKFDMLVNKKQDLSIRDNWPTLVEDFIPTNVSSFFFFDGEKIEEYADLENSKKIFKKSIKKLLGLDIVDLLNSHINQILTDQNSEGDTKNQTLKAEIENIEKQISHLEEIKDNLDDQLNVVDRVILQEKSICEELNSQFKESGGSVLAKQKEIDAELSHAKNKFLLSEHNINLLALEDGPMALAYPLLTKLTEKLEKDKEDYEKNIFYNQIKNKYNSLKKISENTFDKKNSKIFEEILDNDLGNEKKHTNTSDTLFDTKLYADVSNFYYNDYPNFNDNLADELNTYEDTIDEMQSVGKRELGINFEEDINELKNKIVEAEKNLLQKEQEKTKVEKDIRVNASAIEFERRNLNKFIEKFQSIQKNDETQLRMNIHGPKVQETLNQFKEKIINFKLNKIEIFILDTFNQLMNKKNFITKVSIDRTTNELNLYDQKDRKIDLQKLSAGERQLLAVSMIWSFSKASHKKLPTIIDTPLGRLDSNHRMHLVENYFPKAGEQVLLLSTDEEINKSLKTKLAPYIAKSYHLKYDSENQTTSIKEGYFY